MHGRYELLAHPVSQLARVLRDALAELDPGWCPTWDAGWQRCFRLVQNHLKNGGRVPLGAGEVVVQGEDLGRWAQGCRFCWDALLPAQQWLLENALGLEPAGEDERPEKRTQDTSGSSTCGRQRRSTCVRGICRCRGSASSTWRRSTR